jgi:hypothetical protein
VQSKCSLDCHAENQRLAAENHNLHRILVDLQSQNSVDLGLTLGGQEQRPFARRAHEEEVTFDRQGNQQSINLE